MKRAVDDWIKGYGEIVVMVVAAFCSVAVGKDELSWLAAIAIVIASALLPPVLMPKIVRPSLERWSPVTAVTALASAILVLWISILSLGAGLVAIGLTLVAYVGGRVSKGKNGHHSEKGRDARPD